VSSRLDEFRLPYELYPQREQYKESAVERVGAACLSSVDHFLSTRFGQPARFARSVERLEGAYRELSFAELDQRIDSLRLEAVRSGINRQYLCESFAAIRELSGRHLGMRHFHKQIVGGWALMQGMVAEMETGQGKTLTATLAAGSTALAGIPTHVITVNEYLATRDAQTMAPLYNALGLSVGVVTADMSEPEKSEVYQNDIVYMTNKQAAFDYLRDRMVMGEHPSSLYLQVEKLLEESPRTDRLMMRGLCFAIVDEADSVLVDEAVTPLILSAPARQKDKTRIYEQALALAGQLEEEDYLEIENENYISLNPSGKKRLESLGTELGGLWQGAIPRDELVVQALKAERLFIRDVNYLVADDKVQIIDEFTGRVMPDRSWERGLHQLIEVKEGCTVSGDRETIARISYQRFFPRYLRLAGMTGTASEVKNELSRVYDLQILKISPQQPLQRINQGERIFASENEKWDAVVEAVLQYHDLGRPVLVGTRSVGSSVRLSELLTDRQVPHRLLNASQDAEEAHIIEQAGQVGSVTVATNMAGRGTDIQLSEDARGLGGLHVIATERHESSRIDRQLFGRCGRQGDPGSTQTLLSLEDDLVRRESAAWISSAVQYLLNVSGGRRILLQWATSFLFWTVQRKAEFRNRRSRDQVQKMDEHYGSVLAFTGQME